MIITKHLNPNRIMLIRILQPNRIILCPFSDRSLQNRVSNSNAACIVTKQANKNKQ